MPANKGLEKFMTILGYVMVAIYIGLGALLLITKAYDYVPKVLRVTFAFFFIAYGMYRFARIYSKKNEDQE